MGFRLQQKSMTLNDLERGRNGWLLSVVLTSCYICIFVLVIVLHTIFFSFDANFVLIVLKHCFTQRQVTTQHEQETLSNFEIIVL